MYKVGEMVDRFLTLSNEEKAQLHHLLEDGGSFARVLRLRVHYGTAVAINHTSIAFGDPESKAIMRGALATIHREVAETRKELGDSLYPERSLTPAGNKVLAFFAGNIGHELFDMKSIIEKTGVRCANTHIESIWRYITHSKSYQFVKIREGRKWLYGIQPITE